MQVPLELSFRGVEDTQILEDEVRAGVARLERVCDHIISCKVAVEKTQMHQERGNPFRIRIDLTVPPGHEIAVRKEPSRGNLHEPLLAVLHDAFDAVRRQLQELVEKQHGRVKTHPEQEVNALVEKIFKKDGYGFLKTLDGTEVYFHKNSVLHKGFDRLEKGTGVHYVEEMGEKGPQASTVRIVDKPSL
ncbi:MAG: HPF/RaiA family ribosome-associated protein [Candidatus Omnitrophica bacterium]|nr:HPF/RaiA family ribosome-associated protein [Candidatus Omnitrophota bacterium]